MNRRNFFRLAIGAVAAVAIGSTALVTPKRQLKAAWTAETAEDLRHQHNMDAERELTKIMAREIRRKIDREVMADLRRIAA